jgi:pilus assembly protein Flp/PilA
MDQFISRIRNFGNQEDGATMVEYGLMVALIAVVCLVAVTALGVNVAGIFQSIATSVGGGTP